MEEEWGSGWDAICAGRADPPAAGMTTVILLLESSFSEVGVASLELEMSMSTSLDVAAEEGPPPPPDLPLLSRL